PVRDFLCYFLRRVIFGYLVPPLYIHLRFGAQSLLHWPLPLRVPLSSLLHVLVQLRVQHVHFSIPFALPLHLPLLLHHFPRQDIVVCLHVSARRVQLGVHAEYAQFCGHGVLALLLNHGAPDVVHFAPRRVERGRGHASRWRVVSDFLPLPAPRPRLVVGGVLVAVAGVGGARAAAVAGGSCVRGGRSTLERRTTLERRSTLERRRRSRVGRCERGGPGRHLQIGPGQLPVFQIRIH
ncbi:hypothetical protein NL108_016427, partial [Boleophthalmus pectinirostris]